MLLRARTVLPVCAPPIDDGAVLVVGERIARVGRWEELRPAAGDAEVIDLGQAVLLPGLINAHCHLDYTDMGGLLSPAKHFSDWIKAIVSLKARVLGCASDGIPSNSLKVNISKKFPSTYSIFSSLKDLAF